MLSLVTTRQQFDAMFAALADERIVSLDTETTGLHWWRDRVIGVSLANRTQAWYVPFRHTPGGNAPLEWLAEMGTRLAGRQLVGANLNFDMHFLRREPGWQVPDSWHDVQLMAYLLNENRPLKLEELAKADLGIDGDAEERQLYDALRVALVIKGKRPVPRSAKAQMHLLWPVDVAPYAARDALSARQLFDVYVPQIEAAGMQELCRGMEAYQAVLHAMEETGLDLDLERLDAERAHAERRTEELAAQIRQESGGVVENPGSHVQLARWLGTESSAKLHLDVVMRDPDVYAELHPKVALIREYRQFSIAATRYYGVMSETHDAGVLHPSFRITGAAVRLSSGGSGLNAQAIPRTKEEAPHPAYHGIKSCFRARDGHVLAEVDFCQAELFMTAHFSRDPRLCEILKGGQDLHALVAKENGIPRSQAKALNFSISYGVGAAKFAIMNGCTVEAAAKAIAGHAKMFPKWRALYFGAQDMARQTGVVRLFTGRTRHFNDDREAPIHSAMNALMQGSVTEAMRLATLRIAKEVPEFKMGLTVHDSLIANVPTAHRDEVLREVLRIMHDWPKMDPPLGADAKVGQTWATVKDWKA